MSRSVLVHELARTVRTMIQNLVTHCSQILSNSVFVTRMVAAATAAVAVMTMTVAGLISTSGREWSPSSSSSTFRARDCSRREHTTKAAGWRLSQSRGPDRDRHVNGSARRLFFYRHAHITLIRGYSSSLRGWPAVTILDDQSSWKWMERSSIRRNLHRIERRVA